FLFVAVFRWGIAGAALATSLGQLVGGVAPLVYFLTHKDGPLHFCRTRFYGNVLIKTCLNGSSELMTNISASVVSMVYNFQLMRLAGEDGVAAYGVVMYVSFIFAAIFIGYSIGCAPIVSFHYGAQGEEELKNLFRKSLCLLTVGGIAMAAGAAALSGPLSRVFVGYDEGLFNMTVGGMRIFSLSFLVCGFNIFGSAFFTALNNGLVSAVISFMRTFVFQILVVLTLPLVLELDGIWWGITLAELLAFGVTLFYFVTQRRRYHYA
ncbi:MAG: MATE family efflux transporter, partial [Oscillospiraceae bacterium]|nr:MATE family efflux transporter [Oscillospiraceae bacterium]